MITTSFSEKLRAMALLALIRIARSPLKGERAISPY